MKTEKEIDEFFSALKNHLKGSKNIRLWNLRGMPGISEFAQMLDDPTLDMVCIITTDKEEEE